MKEYKTNCIEFSLKKTECDFKKVKILNSEDAYKFAMNFYGDDLEIYESSFIILMNHANNTIGFVKVSQGGIDCTIVDTRIVCKFAIDTLSTAVIFVHNHPTGYLRASQNDIRMAKKLKDALKILDIALYDSIIISSTGYTSMANEGLI